MCPRRSQSHLLCLTRWVLESHQQAIAYYVVSLVRLQASSFTMLRENITFTCTFPVLTHLELSGFVDVPALPGTFLGGSAPCLRHLCLASIPFPELPSLLLSARDLVSLKFDCTPLTGYISPEALVIGLAGLTRLRTLSIHSPTLSQTKRLPDPPMLIVLPALTRFVFGGDSEYLEVLLAQTDTPQVDDVGITYAMQEVQTHQLSQFIDRTANFKQFRRSQVTFSDDRVDIELDRPQGERRRARLSVAIWAGGLDF